MMIMRALRRMESGREKESISFFKASGPFFLSLSLVRHPLVFYSLHDSFPHLPFFFTLRASQVRVREEMESSVLALSLSLSSSISIATIYSDDGQSEKE